ncbi:MAG: hypothetical protein DRO65_00515 [Candidatus Altiarchaeales archaeon]|nr:MAG: hypothetical protein DRO65_00515 [Candidatus Altiarchaeales archaeon]
MSRLKKMVTSKKKSIRDAAKILSDVPEDKVFYVRNGHILRNLRDLVKELETMDFQTFHHHVNPEKNDFANWINDVIGDKTLANEIRKLKTRRSIARHVTRRIKQLEKELKRE